MNADPSHSWACPTCGKVDLIPASLSVGALAAAAETRTAVPAG